jgi:hypothetical protein
VNVGEMKNIGFISNNYALAGVIEALLLVGLIAIVLSIIQLAYIPIIMEQKEAEHIDLVANQFSQLKSVTEIQSMMGVLQTDKPIVNSPISSPIKLGNEKLPYFISASARGRINVTDKEKAINNNKIIDILPACPEYLNGIPLTSINYYIDTFYFLYELKLVTQGGCIITNQTDTNGNIGETMTVLPSMNIENNSGAIKINYLIPIFVSKPGKNMSMSGFGTTFIRTNYTKNYTHSDTSINFIYIYTEYLDAWNESLISENSGLLYEYYDNGYINVGYDDPLNPDRIEITPGTKDIDIEFTIVELGVQIGPGIVT